MASQSPSALLREPCEDDSCPSTNLPTFYCAQCDCSFCDTCWDRQPPHKPRKRGTDGQAHEKIDRLVVERYRDILEPTSDGREQEELHRDDEDTTWFGIGRNEQGQTVFEDYGQYATLMAESLSEVHTVRYPQLVSFIGQTGAGKSTVVKMLISHQDMKTNPTTQLRFPTPVVGSVNDNIPVSANVHLYADPETQLTTSPVLYADCEGLEGGESDPRAEAIHSQDRNPDVNMHKSGRKRPRKKGNGPPRNLPWANGDKEKSKREYAVTELYPRLLYTFSDVVVFVLRNPKTFESAVLPKVIAWASSSFEKSLGQPALPHLVITFNATDLAIDASQWNVQEATRKFLSDIESSVERVPALQTEVSKWRLAGRSIVTTKDLLECYYSSVTVVRIPAKGRYMLIDQQVNKLHTEIVIKCNQSHYMKRRVRMLSNSDDLQLYLQLAFDHFAQDLDHPFNFIEVALRINPIPSDFSGNILKLAVAIRDQPPTKGVAEIFAHLSLMVASCIMLDIHRHRRPGMPSQLLDDHYLAYCEQAFSDFSDRHWPCNFRKKKDRCVNVYFGHATKGHQNQDGKVLASGDFIPSFHYDNDLGRWIYGIEREVMRIQASRDQTVLSGPTLNAEGIVYELHLQNLIRFYSQLGSARNFVSHSTCFCCLREIPVHPLSCGHVLCTPCVRSYGVPNGRGSIEIIECPIGKVEERWSESCLVQFKPPLAGVRVLCLDGGGMRGIVELEVLAAIEQELPDDIPIKHFFDLIVGTSTGGIIALGLTVEGWSVGDCIHQFSKLCETAFTPRELHGIPGFEQLAMMNHGYSKYKTKSLEDTLKKAFSVSHEPLFGGQHSQSSVRVAVTSTRESGSQAVIMANYNRSLEADDQSAGYCFERAERPDHELTVWEAARATSAAPSYFKCFKSERNNRGYWDGALYHNNPVHVAESERRKIWPDTEDLPADILLSIGTSCNTTISKAAKAASHSSWRGYDAISDMSMAAAKAKGHSLFVWKRRREQPGKLIKLMKNRVESILDTETTWLKFQSDAVWGSEENKQRYQRINPNIGVDPPKLDEAKELSGLQQRIKNMTKDAPYRRHIRVVARRLVASCFYVESSTLPANVQDPDMSVTASIKCRFSSGSREIRNLGEYLKNVTTKDFQPYFIINETNSNMNPQIERLTLERIQDMMLNAFFEIGPLNLPISNKAAVTSICLSIATNEELPISGFPRNLIPKRIVQASLPTPDKSHKQARMKQLSRSVSVDDASSSSNENSSMALPELQKLPKEVKLPIRDFVRERISSLNLKDEDVPIKLKILAEATNEVDDDDDKAPVDGELEWSGSILHIAAAIGHPWIIDMQIEAGVDLAALDHNMWTASMVATAQGHSACVQLLTEHIPSSSASTLPDVLPPSCLARTRSSRAVQLGPDRLSVTPTSFHPNLQQRAQVRSNHPIPPTSTSFYYEMTILQSGPLKYVYIVAGYAEKSADDISVIGLGLCRPEADMFGMPGWRLASWGYHGDDGKRFNSQTGQGLRYAKGYTTADTVGCGINMQTGKVFFTLNGRNLGKSDQGDHPSQVADSYIQASPLLM